MVDIRKKYEKRILACVEIQDPSGFNTKKMQAFFATLSDADFKKWMISLYEKKSKIPLYQIPFVNVIEVADSLKTAKFLGIAVFERLRLWDSVGQRHYLTPHAYPILRLPVRRLKQHRDDGISVPESDKRLNPLTDQVVQPDKGSAISLPQAQVMVSQGLYKTTDEFLSVRGGDIGAYTQFKRTLEETGRVSLSELTDSTGVKSAEMLNVLLTSMHYKNNI